MSHLHIPDGIIAPFSVLISFIAATILLALSARKLKRADLKELVPRIGIIGAVMLVGMVVPLPFLGYHLNLSVLAGIILGPAAAFISVFTVNLILALIGHGGITVVGLNAIIMGAEASLGFLIFKHAKRRLSMKGSAFLAAIVALIISTSLMIGAVVLTGMSWEEAAHIHEKETAETHEAGRGHDEGAAGDTDAFIKFAKVVVLAASIGWLIEAFIISETISFINKVRPDLIDGGQS